MLPNDWKTSILQNMWILYHFVGKMESQYAIIALCSEVT